MYISDKKITLDIDYAEKYGIKSVQEDLKVIMSKIDSVCRTHDINYSIAYGTQIGAVRHGGFIPWDDDMDIIMTRDDFNKFRDVLSREPEHEMSLMYYLWVERVIYRNNPDLFIDIMILDNFPANKAVSFFKASLCRMFQGTMKEELDYSNYSFIYKILLKSTGLIGKILGKKACLSLYQKVQQIGNRKDCRYVASYNSGFRDVNEPFPVEWFEEYVDIHFEELILRTNICIDEFLTAYYGNYMELPPEEKRIPEHGRLNV